MPKSNSGMWNSKMSLRLSAFLYGGRSEIPHAVRNRLRNLMKYNEIATPRPLQFLMVGVRNDKKGCGYYALEGLTALVNTIEEVKGSLNPFLQIDGLLRTMYDPRNRLSNDVTEQLNKHFGDKLFRTVIPRNIRLAEAPSYGLPALMYDKSSRGAQAYLALAGEMLRRDKAMGSQVMAANA